MASQTEQIIDTELLELTHYFQSLLRDFDGILPGVSREDVSKVGQIVSRPGIRNHIEHLMSMEMKSALNAFHDFMDKDWLNQLEPIFEDEDGLESCSESGDEFGSESCACAECCSVLDIEDEFDGFNLDDIPVFYDVQEEVKEPPVPSPRKMPSGLPGQKICRNGDNCTRIGCVFRHITNCPDWGDCSRSDCPYRHPAPCQYGKKCWSKVCFFSHSGIPYNW